MLSIFIFSLNSCSKEEPVTQGSGNPALVLPEAPDKEDTAEAGGIKTFTQNCQVCHGAGGKGDICPDLTDSEWKYGNSDKQLFNSISMGRPEGMPAWGNSLSEKQIAELIDYIRSISEK